MWCVRTMRLVLSPTTFERLPHPTSVVVSTVSSANISWYTLNAPWKLTTAAKHR